MIRTTYILEIQSTSFYIKSDASQVRDIIYQWISGCLRVACWQHLGWSKIERNVVKESADLEANSVAIGNQIICTATTIISFERSNLLISSLK